MKQNTNLFSLVCSCYLGFLLRHLRHLRHRLSVCGPQKQHQGSVVGAGTLGKYCAALRYKVLKNYASYVLFLTKE